MLTTLLAIWVVITVILIALSIHRSILVMREQDTVILSESETASAGQNAKILQQLKRLEFVLTTFSFSSGILMLFVVALWVYQQLYG